MLAVFLVLITVGSLYFYFKYSSIVIPENAPIDVLQKITKEYQNLIRQTAAINFLLAVGISPYFIRLGLRTLKYKQYPPPNTAVVFRTKIVKGKMALASAIGCFVMGVFVWAGFIFGLFMEYLFHEFT